MHLQARTARATTLLTKNPGLFCRVILGKIQSARPLPPLPVRKCINGVQFEYDLARYRGTAPMFFGSYAPLVIETMKRYLHPGGVFIDVGANIGYLSAIGAGLVGTRGQVHSFEPVPAYYRRLLRLRELNPQYTFFANSCAAGETTGTCTIYVTREPGQNSMVPAYQRATDIVSTLDVPVVRLDDYLVQKNLRHISLIKIDAEGFEFPVLTGLERFLSMTGQRPPIVCEIAPRAYSLLGKTLNELAVFMRGLGYSARDLIDGAAEVDLNTIQHVEDVLFLAEASQ